MQFIVWSYHSRQWKVIQSQKIAAKEADSEEKHRKILEQAIADIESFYTEYNKNKTETIEENRKKTAQLNASNSLNDSSLDRIGEKDADFWEVVRKSADKIKRPKNTKDTGRMRQIMQSFASEQQVKVSEDK